MPYTLEDVQKELKEIRQKLNDLPSVVFCNKPMDTYHENDLKISSLMYAPDHSLLYLSGLISKADAELCQNEYREIQKKMDESQTKTASFSKPYFQRIEELKPEFSEIFSRLLDGDLNLAPPIKDKFMKDIKNLRRAAALYELTFLNSNNLKYDLSDILPDLSTEKNTDLHEERFRILWHTALAVQDLKAKNQEVRTLLGVSVCKHFCATVDNLYNVQEDVSNPGVKLRTRKMASYFKGLVPQMGDYDKLDLRIGVETLINRVRHQLQLSSKDTDWQAYLTNWYDTLTHNYLGRQKIKVLKSSHLDKFIVTQDFKNRLR